MHPSHHQNDTVSTDNHRLLSPTDDNIFSPPLLPPELINDILLKLPVKYLLQFRCVCKSWKTLISETLISNKRLAFSSYSYPLKSLFENPSAPVVLDSFTGLGINDYYILGSCNGFLCIYDTDQCNIVMYNPTIGLKSNPSPKISSPDSSMWCNGFGYDQVNDKYKVLAVVQHDGADEEPFTKIYTFGEDSWRTIQDFPGTPSQELGNYLSGTLNWFHDIWYKPHERYVIYSFDLEKETYREFLLPFVGDDCVSRPSLGVLYECLCVCFVNKTHFVAWLMKEYGVVESFTILMTIPRDKLCTKVMNIPCGKLIIDRFPTIELLFISNGVALLKVSSKLILYNLNSGLLDHPSISVFDSQIYCENLISP